MSPLYFSSTIHALKSFSKPMSLPNAQISISSTLVLRARDPFLPGFNKGFSNSKNLLNKCRTQTPLSCQPSRSIKRFLVLSVPFRTTSSSPFSGGVPLRIGRERIAYLLPVLHGRCPTFVTAGELSSLPPLLFGRILRSSPATSTPLLPTKKTRYHSKSAYTQGAPRNATFLSSLSVLTLTHTLRSSMNALLPSYPQRIDGRVLFS